MNTNTNETTNDTQDELQNVTPSAQTESDTARRPITAEEFAKLQAKMRMMQVREYLAAVAPGVCADGIERAPEHIAERALSIAEALADIDPINKYAPKSPEEMGHDSPGV